MTAGDWCTARWVAWRARHERGEHPCDSCPIHAACTAPLPGSRLTLEAIEKHAQGVEAAWRAKGLGGP